MKRQHITRLEANLEKLVEGTFASLFGRKIRIQDVALQLARAMKDGLITDTLETTRYIAPDLYNIYLNPKIHNHLMKNYPQLASTLSNHLVDLATQSGYRIINHPRVNLFSNTDLDIANVIVNANHSNYRANSTAAMQKVDIMSENTPPKDAQLIIGESRTIPIETHTINIGRNPNNHIILDDPHTSRHHVQLRLRFNSYWLFDVNSQGGTFVNGAKILEHRLQSGDVIKIGNTQMLYIEDEPASDLDQTEAFDSLL